MPDHSQTDVHRRFHVEADAGSTRGAWIGHWRGFTAVTTIAAVLVVGFAVCASAKVLAGRLAGRDPGARLGGDTIVATGRGEQIVGVPHRPNFIVALGSGETIAGGAGNDELGTLAENVTIRGGGGNDLLYGGRGATLIGGAGRNLIIDAKDNATVRLTSPGNEVVVSGRNDRVLCAAGIRNEVIYAGASDSISQACRAEHARVLPAGRFRRAPSTQVSAQPVEGDGSNANPFTAVCDNDSAHPVDCTVSSFPERKLGGFWSNEYVPAYKCPAHNPYLYYADYDPGGTTLAYGVEVQGLGPVGVSITGTQQAHVQGSEYRVVATMTGLGSSSATNWDGDGSAYRVILHCTSNPDNGWGYSPSGP